MRPTRCGPSTSSARTAAEAGAPPPLSACEELVVQPLLAQRAGGAVAGQELDVVAERQQLGLDPGDQRARGCHRENRCGRPSPRRQRVARQQEAQLLLEEGDMAGRMAGHMLHREGDVADRDLVALVEPARRRHRPHVADVEAQARCRQLVEQELVGLMRPDDRHGQRFRQFRRAAGMVEMAMGQPDRDRRDADLLQRA